ncbi:LysR family transcriptional regulator [Novosphingobium terrae]|uniref:LysR family transcriptional regulator n=1 Tax=Novosphingobium terrae TaxID=2726189 RepID=UPI00197EB19D|nr:LysR family transcriptional regulator [Novosphingobium terrae]
MRKDTPYNRFPSLNALKAFEAAARLGGFAPAAEELLVTPGAVAAQIKLLEAECGGSLFERHARGVKLTPLGESVTPHFIEAFDLLAEAVTRLRQAAAPLKVHIATSPALAQLWLAPRLLRLRGMLPDIHISVTTLEEAPDLKRGPFDLCLFYEKVPASDHIRLQEEELLPVCTPALARKLRDPADLARVTCIADVVWEDWSVWWAAAAQQGMPLPVFGPAFSLYAIAVQEALLGQGVLMGRRSLVGPYLASGALEAPFGKAVALGQTIALWSVRASGHSPQITSVIAALKSCM